MFSLDADNLKRGNYKLHVRKSLETQWQRQHQSKRDRDLNEKIGIPEKITVQEQLDQYR